MVQESPLSTAVSKLTNHILRLRNNITRPGLNRTSTSQGKGNYIFWLGCRDSASDKTVLSDKDSD